MKEVRELDKSIEIGCLLVLKDIGPAAAARAGGLPQADGLARRRHVFRRWLPGHSQA